MCRYKQPHSMHMYAQFTRNGVLQVCGVSKFFFGAFVRHVRASVSIGHGTWLSEREKRLPHLGWGLWGGGAGLVYTRMSVGQSVTCDMNRESVEDTVFIIWKLSSLKFGSHLLYGLSCTVFGSDRQAVSSSDRVWGSWSWEFVSRFEDMLHSD